MTREPTACDEIFVRFYCTATPTTLFTYLFVNFHHRRSCDDRLHVAHVDAFELLVCYEQGGGGTHQPRVSRHECHGGAGTATGIGDTADGMSGAERGRRANGVFSNAYRAVPETLRMKQSVRKGSGEWQGTFPMHACRPSSCKSCNVAADGTMSRRYEVNK